MIKMHLVGTRQKTKSTGLLASVLAGGLLMSGLVGLIGAEALAQSQNRPSQPQAGGPSGNTPGAGGTTSPGGGKPTSPGGGGGGKPRTAGGFVAR